MELSFPAIRILGVIYGESSRNARAAVGHLLVHGMQNSSGIQTGRAVAAVQKSLR